MRGQGTTGGARRANSARKCASFVRFSPPSPTFQVPDRPQLCQAVLSSLLGSRGDSTLQGPTALGLALPTAPSQTSAALLPLPGIKSRGSGRWDRGEPTQERLRLGLGEFFLRQGVARRALAGLSARSASRRHVRPKRSPFPSGSLPPEHSSCQPLPSRPSPFPPGVELTRDTSAGSMPN